MTNEELVIQIQSGRDDLMPQLWEQVAGLVRWKANRVIFALDGAGSVEFDDLYNSGYLALVDAVPTYDPEGGAFSTWFMFYLKTAFEVATGYRTRTQKKDPLHTAVSLEKPLSPDEDSDPLLAVIPDPMGEAAMLSVEEKLWREQLHNALETVLDELPEGYSEVLRMRYYQGKTLKEAAQLLGITPEPVRQRECKALRKLRQGTLAAYLRPFNYFDCFHGSGLGTFRNSGMSVQEKYLIKQENIAERENKRENGLT